MRTYIFLKTALLLLFALAKPVLPMELIFTTQEFKPYAYSREGVALGPAVEVVRAVCQEMRVFSTINVYAWPRSQYEVRTGKAHGMFPIGWNLERAQWITFSPPILTAEYGFFIPRKSRLSYRDIWDFMGYTVGVYGPSNTSRTLREIQNRIGDLTIDMTRNDESAFKKLSTGRVDAVFSNREVGHEIMKSLGIENVRYAGAFKKLNYYVGFSMATTPEHITDSFRKNYIKLYRQGKIHRILYKYRMEPVPLPAEILKQGNSHFGETQVHGKTHNGS